MNTASSVDPSVDPSTDPSTETMARCPLCGTDRTHPYHRDKTRDYLHCGICTLVFVPSSQHLSAADEKAYYDLHDNHLDDLGYRRFLERLFVPLNARLKPSALGLDVGCGPGPLLAAMFGEAGHRVTVYDPFYAPDTSVLSGPYDFITLSEVVEHMARPGADLDRLWTALKPGGWLGIMTKRVRDLDAFQTWHYITDPTHVSFFADTTFFWLIDHWSLMGAPATLTIESDDVVLIKKG